MQTNVKKLLFFLALFFPAAAFGQGVWVTPQVALNTFNGVTRPIAGATITVCAANAGGIPCAPALVNTVFSNLALNQSLSNPFFADGNGNYANYAMAPGSYTVSVTGSGFSGYSYQISLALSPNNGLVLALPGVFTNTQMNQPFLFSIGNPVFTNGGMFATFLSDALVGETLVPASATVPQANGIDSACQSLAAGTNCVAAYGVGRAGANSEGVWGNNYVASDTDTSGVQHTFIAVIGNETDIGCTSTTTSCHGLDIHPVLTANPTVGWGVRLFGGTNNGHQLPYGLQIDDGIATVGISIGAAQASASQPSQPLYFVGRTAANATQTASIFQNAAGSLILTSPGGLTESSAFLGSLATNVSGCSLTTALGTSIAGSFKSGTAGTCTVTITPGTIAPNGWACRATDLTTPADANSVVQTAYTTTTATISGTTASADLVTWSCVPF
jgi:hypothetical protein